MFGWRHDTTTEERAKLLARMTELLMFGLQTKSYEEFTVTFSNPCTAPDAIERKSRELYFQVSISPTCWYNVLAIYPVGGSPSAFLQGGGDDCGVLIAVLPGNGLTVCPHSIQRMGRD